MVRNVEQVQDEIVQVTAEIRALRHTQGLMRDSELCEVRQRIQLLTVRLDALYEEKRAAQSPAPAPAPAHTAPEVQRPGAAANRLIAQIFGV